MSGRLNSRNREFERWAEMEALSWLTDIQAVAIRLSVGSDRVGMGLTQDMKNAIYPPLG